MRREEEGENDDDEKYDEGEGENDDDSKGRRSGRMSSTVRMRRRKSFNKQKDSCIININRTRTSTPAYL